MKFIGYLYILNKIMSILLRKIFISRGLKTCVALAFESGENIVRQYQE